MRDSQQVSINGLGIKSIDAATKKFQQIGDSVVKQLHASDLLEEQIKMNMTNNHELGHNVKEMAFGFFGSINFAQTSGILLQYHMYSTFLEIETMLSKRDKLEARDQIVSSMFAQAVKINRWSIALNMAVNYESLLL